MTTEHGDGRLRVLVTGAAGFVGTSVSRTLLADGHDLVRASRRRLSGYVQIPAIEPDADWTGIFDGIDVVVHLGARVHVTTEEHPDPGTEFHRVNAVGTETVARAAARQGVQRFVFLSTVGVVGSASTRPVDEQTPTDPPNEYSKSKLAAEGMLADVGVHTGLETVILRVPLVYGPGAPGNLARLKKAIVKGVPMPLGLVRNHRSAINVDNLASAIVRSTWEKSLAGETLYLEDGTVWSSREMVERIAAAVGRSPRLVPVPKPVLELALRSAGKRDLADRLFGSLVVDGSRFRRIANWDPPMTPADAMSRGIA